MNASKKWTLGVLGAIVLLVGAVVVVNIIVDADGILRTDLSRQFQPPNMSCCKIQHLLDHKDKYDSFVFGSSRVANIDVRKIPGGRYYNLFYAAGLPAEHFENIRFLLRNGVSIKNLMIGIDDFSFLFDPREHLSELDLQPHPEVSGKNLTTFYGEYFFKLNRLIPQLAAYIRHNYTRRQSREENRFSYDIEETGMVSCKDCDEDIERNVKDHNASSVFLEPTQYRFLEGNHLGATLDALKNIAVLAKQNRIHLVLFINPLHQKTYLNAHLKEFAAFKRELASITDYYDFSGLNSITTNNYYYYEASHYRLMVGDMMLKTMIGAPPVAVPPDFGFHVTRKNINAHLLDQCREIRTHQNELQNDNALFAEHCDKTLD